ncbi:KIN17-like protein [Mytilus trossulus]|uniref:KIN17-like protein n=1 Tax=Mytilus trossulus TaxID=6551 RepID=UPI003003D4BD
MCFARIPSLKAKEQQTTIKKTKVKSKRRTERDRSRWIQHMERKQPMFELPFSNIRNAAFVNVLETNHSVKVELKRVKEKLKEKNINGEKFKDQHKMKDEEISNLKEQLHTMWERAQLYVKQNEEFREELDKFKSTPENLNIQDLYWQNDLLRSENLRIKTVNNNLMKQQHLENNEIVKNHPLYINLQLDNDQLQKTLDLFKESTMGRKEEREKYEIKIVQLEMQIRQFQNFQQQNQQQQQQQMWHEPPNVYNQRQSFNSNNNSRNNRGRFI